jgi:hypothetical protein
MVNLGLGDVHTTAAFGAQQGARHRINRAAALIYAAQGDHGALALGDVWVLDQPWRELGFGALAAVCRGDRYPRLYQGGVIGGLLNLYKPYRPRWRAQRQGKIDAPDNGVLRRGRKLSDSGAKAYFFHVVSDAGLRATEIEIAPASASWR